MQPLTVIKQFLAKNYQWLIIVGAVIVLWVSIDSWITSLRIDQNNEKIQRMSATIDSLRGENTILFQQRDSLLSIRSRRNETINHYHYKLNNPTIKVETNPDSAYFFLKNFAREKP